VKEDGKVGIYNTHGGDKNTKHEVKRPFGRILHRWLILKLILSK
jgi:hypothetical protein